MSHEVTQAHKVLDFVVDYWPYSLALFGMAAGWLIWAAHQIFPTHAGMEACKNEILLTIKEHKDFDDRRMDRLIDKTDEKHTTLEKKIDRIAEFIMKGKV